jgi:hypothetical protein
LHWSRNSKHVHNSPHYILAHSADCFPVNICIGKFQQIRKLQDWVSVFPAGINFGNFATSFAVFLHRGKQGRKEDSRHAAYSWRS